MTGTAVLKPAAVSTSALQKPQLSADSFIDNSDIYFEREFAKNILVLLERVSPDSPMAYRFCAAAENTLKLCDDEGKDFPKKKRKGSEKSYYRPELAGNKKVDKEDWNTLLGFFREKLEKLPEVDPNPAQVNLMRLCDSLGLSQTGKQVVHLLYVLKSAGFYGAFFGQGLGHKSPKVAAALAVMLGKQNELKQITHLLSPSGQLYSCGILERDTNEFDEPNIFPMIDQRLLESLSEPNLSEAEIVGNVLGKPVSGTLDISDFSHLQSEVDLVLKTVKAAVEKGEKGVNILLVGPAGGGKTELAKAIAAALKFKLFAVGEKKVDGADINSYDSGFAEELSSEKVSVRRMAQLRRAQSLLKGSKDAIVFFDEIEDILLKGTDKDKKADTESKIDSNRMLDDNPVVTIWAGNNPEKFDEFIRRRFKLSIFVDYQPTNVRKRIWERQLGMNGLKLTADETLELARKFSTPPSMIANAVHVAALSGGGIPTIEKALELQSQVVFGGRTAIVVDDRVPKNYSLDLVNAGNVDIKAATEQLSAAIRAYKPVSLYLRAQPGAGGSSLLRYIAENAMCNIVESDVSSIYVINNFAAIEESLKEAFQRASNSKSFLVFKGIEGLGGRTTKASEWADSHRVRIFTEAAAKAQIPFAVVSKYKDEAPQEFSAKFSHKINLDCMSAAQAAKAWDMFFGKQVKRPRDMSDFKGVAPGDFAAVRRELEIESAVTADTKRIAEMLKKQAALRSGGIPFLL